MRDACDCTPIDILNRGGNTIDESLIEHLIASLVILNPLEVGRDRDLRVVELFNVVGALTKGEKLIVVLDRSLELCGLKASVGIVAN